MSDCFPGCIYYATRETYNQLHSGVNQQYIAEDTLRNNNVIITT